MATTDGAILLECTIFRKIINFVHIAKCLPIDIETTVSYTVRRETVESTEHLIASSDNNNRQTRITAEHRQDHGHGNSGDPYRVQNCMF